MLTFLRAGTNIPFHFAMFKLFSYSDMGMLFQRSHISFQTTGKRIRIHSHFLRSRNLWHQSYERAFEVLPLRITGFASTFFACQAMYAKMMMSGYDFLTLITYFGSLWVVLQTKGSLIGNITSKHWIWLCRACISLDKCAHLYLALYADKLHCRQF